MEWVLNDLWWLSMSPLRDYRMRGDPRKLFTVEEILDRKRGRGRPVRNNSRGSFIPNSTGLQILSPKSILEYRFRDHPPYLQMNSSVWTGGFIWVRGWLWLGRVPVCKLNLAVLIPTRRSSPSLTVAQRPDGGRAGRNAGSKAEAGDVPVLCSGRFLVSRPQLRHNTSVKPPRLDR